MEAALQLVGGFRVPLIGSGSYLHQSFQGEINRPVTVV